MNGLVFLPQPALSPRERMTARMDDFAFGVLPELSCEDCRASLSDRCPRCAEKISAATVLNEGIDGVQNAAGEDTAMAACVRAVLSVLGISPADAVRVLTATTSGGDAGPQN